MDNYIFDYEYLNKKIQEYLKQYDLELEDLANSIGITGKTLQKSLNNDRDFYLSEIFRLSEVLKLTDKERIQAFFTIGA